MNAQFRRRLSVVEVKVVPKLSPVEEKLCKNEHFVALVSSLGLNIAALKRSGDVLGGLPRDVLRRLIARLKVAAEQDTITDCLLKIPAEPSGARSDD